MVLSRAITQIEAEVSHERERNEEPSQEAARPLSRLLPPRPPPAASRTPRKDAVLPEALLSSCGLSPPPSKGSPGAVTPLHIGPGRKKKVSLLASRNYLKNLKMILLPSFQTCTSLTLEWREMTRRSWEKTEKGAPPAPFWSLSLRDQPRHTR